MHVQEKSERTVLLNSSTAAKNNGIDKYIFGVGGLGSMGAFGVAIFSITASSSETSKWVAIGASVTLFAISCFGLYQSFRSDQKEKLNSESVVIETSNSISTSELTHRISELVKLVPEQNNTQSDLSLQINFTPLQVAHEQLSSLESYFRSQQNTILQNYKKEEAVTEIHTKPDQCEKDDLRKEIKEMELKLSNKNSEIERLNNHVDEFSALKNKYEKEINEIKITLNIKDNEIERLSNYVKVVQGLLNSPSNSGPNSLNSTPLATPTKK
jgi:hypothetical protein